MGPLFPEADFDFASANAAFDKAGSVAGTGADNNGEDVVVPPAPKEAAYDKKASFWDSLSSDVVKSQNYAGPGARGGGGHGSSQSDRNYDRQKERSKNLEAFGEAGGNGAGAAFGRRGGRGRGRGGGYYGGGGRRVSWNSGA